MPAGHQAEHNTIGEETGPAEHAAHSDSAERLEQVVDKFGIHNFCQQLGSCKHNDVAQNCPIITEACWYTLGSGEGVPQLTYRTRGRRLVEFQ